MAGVISTARAVLNAYRNRRDVRSALAALPPGDPLRAPLESALKPPSSTAIRNIEARRAALLDDRSKVDVIDYGAGASTDNPSADTQRKGRLLTKTVADFARASKPQVWGRFLHHLVTSVRPRSVLELGTCVGISGSYIATALDKTGGGRLVTLEGAPELARIAAETFRTLGLDRSASVVTGPFHETLEDVLKTRGPFDLVFVDGHHDGPATIAYFERIRPHVPANGVIVFDDIRWSDGMREAWRTITASPAVASFTDLGAIGVVTMKAP